MHFLEYSAWGFHSSMEGKFGIIFLDVLALESESHRRNYILSC